MGRWGRGMHDEMYGFGPGLVALLLLAAVVAVVVVAVLATRRGGAARFAGPRAAATAGGWAPGTLTPRQVLDMRLARGEVDVETYRAAAAELDRSAGSAGGSPTSGPTVTPPGPVG